ncbi:NAD(P)-dependent oxidoreductase [Halobacteriales archaeon QS_5_70_15]|nr:MAG: NAD(P)-dependent oxidoreductase [Halobacteriales archaeon QS_5_70_15]
MSELDGEVIVVTGANRGLGREMSLRFAREGARVVLVGRTASELEAVAEEADAEGAGGTLVAPADVTESTAVESMIESTRDAFGRVDTLVNNAGIGLLSLEDGGRPTHDVPEERWRRIVDVNLTGVFLCSKAALPGMLERGRGNVINISSGLGRYAAPGYAPYNASKHGLEGLTKTMALDYEEAGVNVNALDPGGRVNTAFWDHLPDDERAEILGPEVMNDAAVLLAAQGPGGVIGESMNAEDWEARLG